METFVQTLKCIIYVDRYNWCLLLLWFCFTLAQKINTVDNLLILIDKYSFQILKIHRVIYLNKNHLYAISGLSESHFTFPFYLEYPIFIVPN